MGLFRSEEHLKEWADYEPEAEEATMPLADWARCFATQACRTRLAPDTLSRQQTYGSELLAVLADLGRDGPDGDLSRKPPAEQATEHMRSCAVCLPPPVLFCAFIGYTRRESGRV